MTETIVADPVSTYVRGRDFRLLQGNSLDVLASFDDQTFGLVFADPPYFLSNGGFTCKSGKRAPVRFCFAT